MGSPRALKGILGWEDEEGRQGKRGSAILDGDLMEFWQLFDRLLHDILTYKEWPMLGTICTGTM